MEWVSENWNWLVWIVMIAIAFLLLRAATKAERVRFEPTGRLFARHPLRLWQSLAEVLKGEYLVLPEVSLNRIMKLAMNKKPKALQDSLGKLKLDFLLLEPDLGRPRLAIKVIPAAKEEGDAKAQPQGESDREKAQQECDRIEELLQKVDIQLWRIEESTGYPRKMIKEKLTELKEQENA